MPETLISKEEMKAAQKFEFPEEKAEQKEVIDASKCQMNEVIKAYKDGKSVDVESFSPYLKNYNVKKGTLNEELTKEDKTGLEILKLLNKEFPNAQAVSLYDEYNTPYDQKEPFTQEQKDNFLQSIEDRLEKEGAKIDHFISESSKIESAKSLVDQLKTKGVIKEKGSGAIYFNDGQSQGGQFDEHFFPLKTKGGRWMCEALDASSFLDKKNLEITHLVILPERFKIQQERVWNILKTLGIRPEGYHNIFFNPDSEPNEIVQKIQEEIEKAK